MLFSYLLPIHALEIITCYEINLIAIPIYYIAYKKLRITLRLGSGLFDARLLR